MVYVISKHGKALMPTARHRKVRLWLKSGKAKVVSHTPFTIQLLFETGDVTQDLTLGMDTGFETVGVSVVSEKKEVFSAEIQLRKDVSDKMTERRMYRRNRRNRLWHRKPRFLNRKKTQVLAPSVKQKVDSHLRIIELMKSRLPITKVIVETGTFDPHKLKKPDVKGKAYQQGEQYGYENVKAYVLARDQHQCQAGKKGCKPVLNVHHIKFKSQGGSDNPDNLMTLCEKHHEQLHAGKLKLNVKKHKSLKSATMMNIIRSQLLKTMQSAIETFGYITKAKRQEQNLEKTHANDAFIIAGGLKQQRFQPLKFFFKRKNNRSLQKNRKGFAPSIRKQRYSIQPHDLVVWQGKQYKAIGIQNKGAYLKMTDGVKTVVKSVKQICIIFHQKTLVSA
jgi:hypothetical protein